MKICYNLIMNKELISEKQKEIKTYCRNQGISYLGLFGSSARGQDTAQSDIDFYTKYSSDISLFDVARNQIKLSEILGKKVDLIINPNPFIKNNINKDLITIYEAD